MKIAFVYDRINKIGGAERLLRTLHKIWPQAPFFTSLYNPKTTPFTKDWKIKSALPLKNHHEYIPFLMPFAFESFNFSDFDVVVSITSAEAKGIITSPKTLHLCYCLTPTRYLYSHASHYQKSTPSLAKPVLNWLKNWDQVASTRPDHYLAISKTVQNRIKKYYQRDSQIIYPPVNTDFFKPASTIYNLRSKYYLIVSRLVSYKNIDLAIKACNKLKLPLKIVGTGRQEKKLRAISGKTIEFLGKVSDSNLLKTYQNCNALIFPGREDFGLTMVEALSCGRPVIAYNKGGATEIIQSKKSGQFFDKLNVSSLADAIYRHKKTKYDLSFLRQNSLKYSQDNFKNLFKNKVNTLWQQHQRKLQ